MRRSIQSCLAAIVMAGTTLAAALAAPANAAGEDTAAASTGNRIFSDDFRNGFSHTGTDAKWALFSAGSLAEGDGIPTTSANGLTVVPTGRNALTGKPAFAFSTGQEHDGGAGAADHVKWYAYANHTASSGLPGFDATPGQVLTCGSRLGARTYGTEQHPFGSEVSDPQSDLRLAAGAMSMVDFETLTVFDFFVTNSKVYAFYERLPQPGATYAAFSYALPVADSLPGWKHDLAISYDREAGVAVWKVDGREVMRQSHLGYRPADRAHLALDLGGTEQPVAPRQLSCGIAMFVLLDAAGSNGRGLVRLTEQENYYNPRLGAPTPQQFADELSLPANRLWGQGARLDVDRVTVTSTPKS